MTAYEFLEGYVLTVAGDGTITIHSDICSELRLVPNEHLLVPVEPEEAAVVPIALPPEET